MGKTKLFCAIGAVLLLAAPARATAIASVREAFWQANFSYYLDGQGRHASLPAGVSLMCTGSAVANGLGCADRQSASVMSDDGTLHRAEIDALSSLVLVNNGPRNFDGRFVFATSYSAFNPGGPNVGASVDHGGREYASFFSVVRGPALFDLQGCNMSSGIPTPTVRQRMSCGVSSPDASESEFSLGPLAANAEAAADFQIYISLDAQGEKQNGDPVPEAPTLAVFLVGLAALRRRQGVKA